MAGQARSPFIVMENISKRFGSVWANRRVRLDIAEGEVHAVVGENGAGKSTLMKVLYGALKPDGGRILVNGAPVHFRHPREAIRAGIGMVHQHLLVFPQLTVLENIVAGAEPRRWGFWQRGEAGKRALALCEKFGFELPLQARADDLPFAQRQQMELLKALYRKARVLVLDEPTSLLAPPEVDRLLHLLKDLRSKGATIVFISHRLREVFSVADRITVLRNGTGIGTWQASETTQKQLAAAITGGTPQEGGREEIPSCAQDSPDETSAADRPDSPFLILDKVSTRSSWEDAALDSLSLEIWEGEILGIGAVVGNGERTLAKFLAGFAPALDGRLLLDGRDITSTSGRDRLRRGFRWLPANPFEEALVPSRPLWENCLLGEQRYEEHHRHGWLLKRRIRKRAQEMLQMHEVKWSGLQEPLSSLSGGNQQKVALGRILAGASRFAILEQPGRGLDIRAQERLRRRIFHCNAQGTSFLVISYDLDELLALCRRIGILFRGRLMGIQEAGVASREKLGKWMLGIGE